MSIRYPRGIISSNTQNEIINQLSTNVGKTTLSYQLENSTNWPYTTGPSDALLVGFGFTPYLIAYSWNDNTGFGTKFSDPQLPTTNVYNIKFTPNKKTVFITDNTVGGIHAWRWDKQNGFGTKFSDPATGFTAAGYGISVSKYGDAVITTCQSGVPYIASYPWNDETGFGTQYADPFFSSITSYNVESNDNYVIVCGPSSPYLQTYQWNSAPGCGLSTRMGSPTTSPGAAVFDVKIGQNDDRVIVGYNASPYLAVHTFVNGQIGTRTAYATSTMGPVRAIQFSEDKSVLFCATTNAPRIMAVAWDGSALGTTYSNPSTAISSGSAFGVHVSRGTSSVAVGTSATPFIHAYKWINGTGFGTKFSNPSTLPTAQVSGISFN